jgi:hypothetical protein
MPPLPNPRQERFVQGLFEGKSADEAYALAKALMKPMHSQATKRTAKTLID